MTDKKDSTIDPTEPSQDPSERWQHTPVHPVDESGVAKAKLEADTDKSSYAGYLFGTAGTAARPAWSDSAKGRATIRLVSRGLFGAGFFIVGSHIAARQMRGYESFTPLSELKPLQNGKPLQFVARMWDNSAGKALEWAAYHITPTIGKTAAEAHRTRADAVWEVTSFRTKLFNSPEKFHTDKWGYTRTLNGRGLGAEIVMVTFDFFMASIGDASARNIIQSFDPNVKQPWLLDEHGHATTRDQGHFHAGKWAQAVGQASWRIFSKNAMEDWAAALPYVYTMKWQRQALAKVFKGFKLSSDNGWNGGVAKVSTSGPNIGQITGGYQIPGLIDLQLRFMNYNWFTLMYREMYDGLGRRLDHWRKGEKPVDSTDGQRPMSKITDGAGFFARYVTKSWIKASMYMLPAVPFFWIFRTPQSKWRGPFVSDELATTTHASRESAFITTHPYGLAQGGTDDHPAFIENVSEHLHPRFRLLNDHRVTPDTLYFGNGRTIHRSQVDMTKKNIFNLRTPYEYGVHRNPIDHVLNVFGAISFHTGSGLTRLVDHISPHGGAISHLLFDSKDALGNIQHLAVPALRMEREKMLRGFVDASFSYTPYMWAKAETALRVDDRRSAEQLGHMDKAIYRFLDNTFALNFKGARKALGDMGRLGFDFEKQIDANVKAREGGPVVQVGDGTTIPRAGAEEVPGTTVDARSVKHGRRATDRPVTGADATSIDMTNRQWAESVSGRALNAQLAPGSQKIH